MKCQEENSATALRCAALTKKRESVAHLFLDVWCANEVHKVQATCNEFSRRDVAHIGRSVIQLMHLLGLVFDRAALCEW
jgi:hypothetical protein